jgi:hypothetical protein
MWTTIVEIEFFHVMRRSEHSNYRQCLWPTPDEVLIPTHNTPVTALTRNGLLLWLRDGTVAHGSWCSSQQAFTRRDGAGRIPHAEVRAWGALAHPVAPL